MRNELPHTFRFQPGPGHQLVRVPVTGEELVAMAGRSPWTTPAPKPAPRERQPVARWTDEDDGIDPAEAWRDDVAAIADWFASADPTDAMDGAA